jgi:hypothetical protein
MSHHEMRSVYTEDHENDQYWPYARPGTRWTHPDKDGVIRATWQSMSRRDRLLFLAALPVALGAVWVALVVFLAL